MLADVLAAVDVPVLAAGGIGTAEQVAAALAAGADGVRAGTAFLAAAEADIHPEYVAAIFEANGADTEISDVFSRDWSGAPHRVLRSAAERARADASEFVGELTVGGRTEPVPRFATTPPTRAVCGEVAAMALYAGQAVGAVTAVRPAADIVRSLMAKV